MRRLGLWFLFCAILVCLFSVACSKSGQSDEALSGTIQQRLAADPALSGQQLHAEVRQGVAVLSGKVATPEQMQAAVKDANTPGVQQVISQIVVVPPLPLAPTISQFTAEPNSIQLRQAATLSWQVTGQAISVSIDQGVGAVPISGSRRVQPNDSVTYTLTATGPGGTNTASTTITVANQPPPPPRTTPAPTITAAAQPTEVQPGKSSILSWNATNAVRVTINGDPVPVSGSKPVFPPATTTYNFVATNRAGESRTFAVQVTVSAPAAPAAEITLRVDPPTIPRGQRPAILRWESRNATAVMISVNGGPGIRKPTATGAEQVSPTETTTYQATATNSAGQAVQSNPVVLTVTEPQPTRITVPSGTAIYIRMIDTVDSSKNHAGDPFRASLEQALAVAGHEVAKKGTDVRGRVVLVKQPPRGIGRIAGEHELRLELSEIVDINNQAQSISTEVLDMKSSNTGGTVKTEVVGGAVGATLGAILGGGKGAGEGAGAGAGAVTLERLIFGSNKLVISSEHVCAFRLRQPFTVMLKP